MIAVSQWASATIASYSSRGPLVAPPYPTKRGSPWPIRTSTRVPDHSGSRMWPSGSARSRTTRGRCGAMSAPSTVFRCSSIPLLTSGTSVLSCERLFETNFPEVSRGRRVCASADPPSRGVPLPITTPRAGGIRLLAGAAARVLTVPLATTGSSDGRASRFGDDGPAGPLRGQLAVHGVLDVAGRRELFDLDVRDLDAPTMRYVVQLHAELLVDLLALGEDIVQGDVPDHGAERGGGDSLDGLPEVLDVQERVLRIDDLLVNEEVDRNRGVVFCDAGLLRDLHHELPKIHGLRDALDRGRQKEHDARSGDLLEAPESEHDEALILGDDVNDRSQHEDRDDDEYADRDETQIHQAAPFPSAP